MPRFVAFLRALNVGGRVVKMDALRRLFEAMGFTDVETFIASGNVAFSSKGVRGLDSRIAAALGSALGYGVPVFVRTLDELAALAARFHVRRRDFWWLSQHRQNEPAISGRALEKALGQPTTLRNVNTVRRMAERYGPSVRTRA